MIRYDSPVIKAAQVVYGLYMADWGYLPVPMMTAHILSGDITEDITAFDHPIENNSKITDHISLNPVSMKMTLAINSNETRIIYEMLRYSMREGKLLVIQGKVRTYPNMLVTLLKHTEDAKDTVTVLIDLKEVRVVRPEYGELPQSNVANPSQSGTVQRGTVNTRSAGGSGNTTGGP